MKIESAEPRRYGPGWPVRPAIEGADPLAVLPEGLRSRGTLSWYIGAGFSLIWVGSIGADITSSEAPLAWIVVGIALLVVFSLVFVLAAPLVWSLSFTGRLIVCAALFALSFALLPWLGWHVAGLWTYVGVIVGIAVLPWRMTWMLVAGLAVLALLFEWAAEGEWNDYLLATPAILASISMMMAAFGRTTASINLLRTTRDQMAVLAADRERGRVARDIHDILGHSLTVITVKAELAGRLIDDSPERARAEIGEVETLARGALADVRATVAGFRSVNVSAELVAARMALDAAGITAELPSSTDALPADRRELAGWVVREGVTNVIRHADATICRVRLRSDEVEVADDGVGPTEGLATSTGLEGLRERAQAAGARMSVGRSDLGGFSLRISL